MATPNNPTIKPSIRVLKRFEHFDAKTQKRVFIEPGDYRKLSGDGSSTDVQYIGGAPTRLFMIHGPGGHYAFKEDEWTRLLNEGYLEVITP